MRVLILGGDGYLGWPTAMRFSGKGHDVAVVDNFARRRWHEQAGTDSLTPIAPLDDRISAWHEVSGKRIESHIGDISEGTFIADTRSECSTTASAVSTTTSSGPAAWSRSSPCAHG